MSIFILEDDVLQAQRMKRLVEEICERHGVVYDFMEVTGKPTDILEKIPLTTFTPIYFLDIEIKDERRKGLEVAQMIRKYDPHGVIVFVTTHSAFAPISYQYMVSAFTFIDKGLAYAERAGMVEKCLLHYEAMNAVERPLDEFVLDNAQATVRLPFHTVEYVMTDRPHRLALVTSDSVLHFYGTLKEIEKMDERLLRCHQSYLVNMHHVANYDAAERMLVLQSGKRVPVSRRLGKKVRQAVKGD